MAVLSQRTDGGARRPLRVVHVITGLGTGGAEMMLRKLLSRMDRGAFENVVVSLIDEGTQGPALRAMGVRVVPLGMRSAASAPGALWRLAALLRRERPDLVQSWMHHADLLATLAGRLAGVPRLVWNIRCSEFQAFGRETRLLVAMLARLSALPDAVAVNSTAGQEVHRRAGYRPRRWELIPNGFDVETYAPAPGAGARLRAELGFPADAPVVGMVARCSEMKDHGNFLRAAALLSGRRPDAHFVLVGAGVEALAGEARALGLERRLALLGRREDVAALVPGFTLATLSSAYGEGFPNVLGEAMACGVPCVATDVGDSAVVIGPAGEVVPPRDPDALAAAWERVLALPEAERAALGRQARARVESLFTLDAVTRTYEQLYRELAAPGTVPAAARRRAVEPAAGRAK